LAKPFSKTKNAEIPIKKYKVVQTGANIKFGGLNAGFCKVAYQAGIALAVNIEPVAPAASAIMIKIKASRSFLNFTLYLY